MRGDADFAAELAVGLEVDDSFMNLETVCAGAVEVVVGDDGPEVGVRPLQEGGDDGAVR